MRGKVFPLLVLLVCGLPGLLLAADPFGFSLSAPMTGKPGELVATLTMRVPPDYFLYRTQVSLTGSGAEVVPAWPPTHRKPDPADGSEVDVWDQGEHPVALAITPRPGALAPGAIGLSLAYQGCSTQTCMMPQEQGFPVSLPAGFVLPASTAVPPASGSAAGSLSGNGSAGTRSSGGGESGRGIGGVKTPSGTYDFRRTLDEAGLLWTLFIAFLGGLLVSLTPCVYPMIPITLSIIGSRRENTSFGRGLGLSVLYVAGLSLTYALLGLVVAFFGAQVRGFLQGPGFQVFLSLMFVFLALSMFDVFLLQVPESVRQRFAGYKQTGLGGVFLLGMVSGLMASPCVAAPLAGILAFIAASGSLVTGFTMLLAFAWGMGLVLIVFGAFSGYLNTLPRAGDWMVRIKEFYGFLLLGAAFSFARPFIGAPWAELATALLLAAFAGFLGLFEPATAEGGLGERVRKCLGVVAMAVACAFAVSSAATWGGLSFLPAAHAPALEAAVFWHDRLEDGLRQARTERIPLFLDFRADWCSICKELEAEVFPSAEVHPLLQKMVRVRIDATAPSPEVRKVLDTFQIVGLPTLVFLDPEGREWQDLRVVGGVSSGDLARNLRSALRGNPQP